MPWHDVAARLRPFISRRVAAAEIDDVLQDVLLRLQCGLSGLRDGDRFTPWLFQIARHAVTDHVRAKRRHDLFDSAVDDQVPAEHTEDNREDEVSLAYCISMFVAGLDSPYREAITLVELEGRTVREAAGVAAVSISAMKSRVQRARAQLRQMFEDCCEIALDVRGKVIDCAHRTPSREARK